MIKVIGNCHKKITNKQLPITREEIIVESPGHYPKR